MRDEEKFTELDMILSEGEAEYLDNGGCMPPESADRYLSRISDYAKRLEDKLDHLGQLSYLNGKRRKR